MLKEIFEQPNSIRDAMRGRLSIEECTAKLGGLNMSSRELRDVDRIVLSDKIEKLTEKYVDAAGFLFFGRQYNYPITRGAESVARILSGRQLVEAFELDNGNIFLVFHGGLHFGIRGSGF